MAVYLRAHVMRDSLFTFNSVDYTNQVNLVRFTPDTPIEQMPVLSPTSTATDISTTIWSLELGGIQDNGSGSLGAALRAASGTKVDVVFQPRVGTGQDKVTATVVPTPIEFGGEQGSWRTFSVTIPVDGQPTFTQST